MTWRRPRQCNCLSVNLMEERVGRGGCRIRSRPNVKCGKLSEAAVLYKQAL